MKMRRTIWWTLAVAINAIIASVSQANTNSCVSSMDGFWDEARIWSLNKPPSIHQSAILITNAASETITIDSTTAQHFKSTLTISNLTISAPSGSTDTLYLDNTGTIALHMLNGLTIGIGPANLGNTFATTEGTLITTNSTLIIGGLQGGQLQDDGTLIVTGGSLITTNCSLQVAVLLNGTAGLLIVSNGTVLARDVTIIDAEAENARGMIELIGGTMSLTSSLKIGNGTGLCSGNFLVANGGLLIVTNGGTSLGGVQSSSGYMTVSNGTFLGADVYIGGFKSDSKLVLDNGTVTLNGQLGIGYGDLCSGSVSMNGGLLVITNNPTTIGVGECDGELTIEDGIFLAREVLVGYLYDSSGMLSIQGGVSILSSNLQVGGMQSDASVSIGNGQLFVTNAPISINGGFGEVQAQLGISGGQLIAKTIDVANSAEGALTVDGGSVTISEGITVGDCSNDFAIGYVTVDGGQLIVTNAAGTGFIDVQNGKLVFSSGVLQADKLVMTNSCSSFVHIGGTLIVRSVVLDPKTFRILSVTPQGKDMLVTWMMGPGATNTLQVTSGDGNGNYATNGFTDIFIVTNNTTVGTLTNYLDIGGATNKPSRYYRARLAP